MTIDKNRIRRVQVINLAKKNVNRSNSSSILLATAIRKMCSKFSCRLKDIRLAIPFRLYGEHTTNEENPVEKNNNNPVTFSLRTL